MIRVTCVHRQLQLLRIVEDRICLVNRKLPLVMVSKLYCQMNIFTLRLLMIMAIMKKYAKFASIVLPVLATLKNMSRLTLAINHSAAQCVHLRLYRLATLTRTSERTQARNHLHANTVHTERQGAILSILIIFADMRIILMLLEISYFITAHGKCFFVSNSVFLLIYYIRRTMYCSSNLVMLA